MTHNQNGISGRDWIEKFAEKLGTFPPNEKEMEALLDLAGVAAHDSERVAAPFSLLAHSKGRSEPI